MTINFPNTPNVDDTYTDAHGVVWYWNGQAWRVRASSLNLASDVALVDAGGFYDADNVEDALAEIGSSLRYFNVRDYGDVGVGQNVDAAFAAAKADAVAFVGTDSNGRPTPNGAVIFFPAGFYTSAQTISIESDFIGLLGDGPSQTVIASTAAGPIMHVGSPTQGTQAKGCWAKGFCLIGDSTNTTIGLEAQMIHFYGAGFSDFAITGFTEAGLYVERVWNAMTFSNFYITDNAATVAGTQYGVLCASNTNGIEFNGINIQSLSKASADTTGFKIVSPQNAQIRNSVIKNCWVGVHVAADAEDNACVGLLLDSLYCEPPNASDGAPTSAPSDYAWMRLRGSATNPIRNVRVINTKCGWGSDESGIVCNIVDVDYCENVVFESVNLKANTSAGTTYHVKATSGSKGVRFASSCILSPSIDFDTQNTDGHSLLVNGDPTGVTAERDCVVVPAEALKVGTNASRVNVGSGVDDYIDAIEFPASGYSYAYATIPIPSRVWDGSSELYARLLYSTSTAVGNIARMRVDLTGFDLEDAVTTTAGTATDQNCSESTTANGLQSRTSLTWSCQCPRSGLVKAVIRRNGDAGTDTCTGVVNVLGLEIYSVKTVTAIDGTSKEF